MGNSQLRAHPRSRGENARSELSPAIVTGSSPLTRGKRPSPVSRTSDAGLIPAHAGKTDSCSGTSRGGRAHPRSRGENLRVGVDALEAQGSSPLTRGKQLPRTNVAIARRLIPAHAGKTGGAPSVDGRTPAHPRSRGENEWFAESFSSGMGSSPLTRGKHKLGSRKYPLKRLIPTHAGKTKLTACELRHIGAHPHSRGENSPMALPKTLSAGSSPLTRGKLVFALLYGNMVGLIPTHAGKTARVPRLL